MFEQIEDHSTLAEIKKYSEKTIAIIINDPIARRTLDSTQKLIVKMEVTPLKKKVIFNEQIHSIFEPA